MKSARRITPIDCAIGWVVLILLFAGTMTYAQSRSLSSIPGMEVVPSKELAVFEELRRDAQAYQAEAIALREEFRQELLQLGMGADPETVAATRVAFLDRNFERIAAHRAKRSEIASHREKAGEILCRVHDIPKDSIVEDEINESRKSAENLQESTQLKAWYDVQISTILTQVEQMQ